MSEFNLIDEPWISVVTDYKGSTKLVGLREFFQNAETYIDFAGDMPTQDFAVMRFILAILHTVFSRFDANGNPYEFIKVNDKMLQLEPILKEDESKYRRKLMETWANLWEKGKFPEVVIAYLKCWHDRFYLFDDDYPFYQVKEDFAGKCELYNQTRTTDKAGQMYFKTINRTISETGSNTAIFSMVNDEDNPFRDKLTNAQLTRWIINFMGYTSTPDKIKIKSFEEIKNIEKYDGHKGWLYSIGGLHYKTDNLFKTLMLNLALVHPSKKFINAIQRPAWEYSPEENIKFYINGSKIDNLARLYTDYSRAMRISEKKDKYGRYLEIIQLPILDKKYSFLECMTVWKNSGNKDDDIFIPMENNPHESLWRNFGMLFNKNKSSKTYRTPYIIDWVDTISKFIDTSELGLVALGIKGDRTSSNTMKNEMYDELRINYEVSTDYSDKGWVGRINDVVEKTKKFVDEDYSEFVEILIRLKKVEDKKIRPELNNYLESLYFNIDKPFKGWLSSIEYDESMDNKIDEWFKIFKNIVMKEVNHICASLSSNYYVIQEVKVDKKKQKMNVALALNDLLIKMKKL
ncbi:hypothetical protein B9N57_01470 [Finegoldia magna]|uniref:type I-E CRISPR-associated protein Cse1/CasA n=1 Tax=Finegoldia magna TaxID=1260 RepID=UPI000B918746|nr:type I-E CRISPR-associated protein Cse1/CasA [Finegoldia magna]OXZ31236.1 hypothetical protein B9N57_01470 [Finegoldia magna]